MEKETRFEKAYKLNVNDKAEKKDNLTYLSWAWAWAEFKKIYPEATYAIKKFNDLPYLYNDATGYMVFTEVTADEQTHEMWLPVMDYSNKTMFARPYAYKTKFGDKTVEAASMFDINKSIMRCLTKNLAMFGLGLYIYAGEDLPESNDSELVQETKTTPKPSLNMATGTIEPHYEKEAETKPWGKWSQAHEEGKCADCGSPKIMNKAGTNTYCAKKCWLQKDKQQEPADVVDHRPSVETEIEQIPF